MSHWAAVSRNGLPKCNAILPKDLRVWSTRSQTLNGVIGCSPPWTHVNENDLLLISLVEDAGYLHGVMKQMLRVILSVRRNRQTFLLSF